ncbi:LSU ribosomal protein L18p (L5e) [Helicobacter heilmannii]|uniref:50S ribosomal protein L18 n=1 Tax=Helicobacter heilmannii TaxID=35817 RepID=UPI0006A18930|nr:50S ribosomal protein L18 [Helicobacter heilmannii]GMB94875.1 50S ribosomal protein L18 [Helicobacter heilmannii]CRF48221.1 LSU ribosomal protein L18p (L5e) [Helicobacter heilmannii]CRF51469.1 LSU ribosomal protein L18p (L5e) [Helicobacter heilmannii]
MTKNVLEKKKAQRAKRKMRVRSKVFGTEQRPRVSVFKSNKHLYAQAIDDNNHATLAHVDGKKLGLGKNMEDSKKIAAAFAENLKAKGITQVVFDRNGYLYHGVVAAFAETLRENNIAL